MRKLLMGLLVGVMLFCSLPAQAQEEDDDQSLWGLVLRGIEYVCENGEPALLYDFAQKESRAAFKLNLVEIKSLVDIDVASVIDRLDVKPGLVACVGTSLESILDKLQMDVDIPFDISAGVFAGYDFGGAHEIYGVQIGWKIEF